MEKRLTYYFVVAGSQGVSLPLKDLLACPDLPNADEDPLGAIEALCREAEEHEVILAPNPVEVRDYSTSIVLSRKPETDFDKVGEKIRHQFLWGEIPNVELKSTLWLDLDRQKNDVNASNADLRSPKMANSAMKTICGFLNENGGHLVIGADDNGKPIGLEEEFQITCPNDQSLDGWLQTLRTTIEQFFHEPADVTNHLRIELGRVDGRTLCLIGVVPRKRLSICRCKEMKSYTVYSRKGTSTEIVGLESIEEFVVRRLSFHD